ncbi:hypothetical protein NZD89_27205 [Alicyclobacillus fastidiosus]|uniref:Uncharacterized protein n=1 Tax=Alicyclobacillus fastidiosus TaxID=392011 RepID=A0ABY6ZGJ3_9BACL|nr:hypothetical protein [Alicyclobacillus fastidiosus]WAH41845.1 hypothetical protein NZD89_27205 [Alicyclobacillus fastidiosus]
MAFTTTRRAGRCPGFAQFTARDGCRLKQAMGESVTCGSRLGGGCWDTGFCVVRQRAAKPLERGNLAYRTSPLPATYPGPDSASPIAPHTQMYNPDADLRHPPDTIDQLFTT